MKKTKLSPKMLMDATEGLYPGGKAYILHANKLVKYYDDDAIDMTRQLLGISDRTPITSNIMKRVVDTLSVTYDQPPARRILMGSNYLPDSEPEVMTHELVLMRSGFDAHFRRVDAYRNLLGTVCRRTYGNSARRSLAHRMFLSTQFFRMPSPGQEDDVSQDEAIALWLRNDQFEMWERRDDGEWTMFITDASGDVLREPFGPDGLSPYSVLPIQLVHDQPAEGRAFMPLKLSRLTFQENINMVLNAVPEMVDFQAYDQMVYQTSDPERATALATGPGTTAVIPSGDSLQAIQRSPAIEASIAAADSIRDQWLVTENIPVDYFKGSSSLQTGAALRAQLWPLKERRDAMQPLVILEQEEAFEINRAVYNFHASDWGEPQIPVQVKLKIQVTDVPIPIDEDKLRDIGFREIAAGLSSTIQYLQRKHQISRSAAIDMYEQIKGDNETYAPAENTNSLVDGPPEPLGPGSATVSTGGFNPDVGE